MNSFLIEFFYDQKNSQGYILSTIKSRIRLARVPVAGDFLLVKSLSFRVNKAVLLPLDDGMYVEDIHPVARVFVECV
jgi:hypothetical protein